MCYIECKNYGAKLSTTTKASLHHSLLKKEKHSTTTISFALLFTFNFVSYLPRFHTDLFLSFNKQILHMILLWILFFFTLSTTSFHFAILASSRNGWTGGAIGSAERGFWIRHHHTPRFRDGNVSALHTPRIPRALSRWEGFAWRSMSYSERMERVEGYELEEGTHSLPVATYHHIFEIYSFTQVISRLCCGLIDYSTS